MTLPPDRSVRISELFPDAPSYRRAQIECAVFDPALTGWDQVSTLPKAMRETLEREVPWMSVSLAASFVSKRGDTVKALLATHDGQRFESVLMANRRGQWTICVSSQIGCAMKCTFCATGAMGLKRSLSAEEIADQYRVWRQYLAEHNDELTHGTADIVGGDESDDDEDAAPSSPDTLRSSQRISNVVFMGMGEPLANYENVKKAIAMWLSYTDLGSTRITVSTVGVLPQLEKLLTDPTWPPVRIAISLHSANQERRKEIVPTTAPRFLEKLADWAKRYEELHGNRRHHVTFEYTLLSGVNDTPELARELAAYVTKTGATKVNVIPWNPVFGKPFERSQRDRIDAFKKILRDKGVTITERKTMGDDIAAACGQLANEQNPKTV